jgi:hypothetical protein
MIDPGGYFAQLRDRLVLQFFVRVGHLFGTLLSQNGLDQPILSRTAITSRL